MRCQWLRKAYLTSLNSIPSFLLLLSSLCIASYIISSPSLSPYLHGGSGQIAVRNLNCSPIHNHCEYSSTSTEGCKHKQDLVIHCSKFLLVFHLHPYRPHAYVPHVSLYSDVVWAYVCKLNLKCVHS